MFGRVTFVPVLGLRAVFAALLVTARGDLGAYEDTLIDSSCWNLTFPAWAPRPPLPRHSLPILNPGTVKTLPILFPSAQLKQIVDSFGSFFYYQYQRESVKDRSGNSHETAMPKG